MKKLTLLLACILSATGLFAQHVTEEQALQKAHAFMQGKVMNNVGGRNNAPAKPRAMKRVAQATGSDALYMFNVEDNGGFVIVSGDERTEAILGYSTEGNIDPQTMPENMRAWLKGYEEQIKAIPEGAKASSHTPATFMPIEPLIKTMWGQDWPFNLQTPVIDGKHCVTGCIATTMAQIMNYWQYPAATQETIPSWRGLDEVAVGTAINWTLLADVYEYEENFLGNPNYSDEFGQMIAFQTTSAQRDAVANLMKMCGMSVQMDYGVEESGASVVAPILALSKYFGYQNEIRYVSQRNYTCDNWERLIYSELSQNRPVMYGGSCDPTKLINLLDGAHSFIVDGYSEAGYFHFNWGWDGGRNGYFLLTAHDFNYDMACSAIVGIQPEAGGTIADIETIGAYTSDVNVLELTNVETDGTLWRYYSGRHGGNIILTLSNCSDKDFNGYFYPVAEDEWGYNSLTGGILATVPAGSSVKVKVPQYMLLMESGTHIIKVGYGPAYNPTFIEGVFTLVVDRERIPFLNIEYTIDGIDEHGLILLGQPCKLHYKIKSLWEGDPDLKADLYLNELKVEHIADFGHIAYGTTIEGEYEILCPVDDDFYSINVMPWVRFHTNSETTAQLQEDGNTWYEQYGESQNVTFCKEKPIFAGTPEEIPLIYNEEDNLSGIYFDDMPAGYYVFRQDGFQSFQTMWAKDSNPQLFKWGYDVAWRDYQIGYTSKSTPIAFLSGLSLTSKDLNFIFDFPSDIPYTNSISATVDGKTIYFPADEQSMKEALERGLYKNEVGFFHKGGSLMVQGSFWYYQGGYFDAPHLYYYPIVAGDLTALVGVTAEDWHAGGMVGWAGPEVTTRDGRTTALAERYEETTETTGTVMEQTVTGLENGLYRVTLYANACYTPGRGFSSDITDGQMDVVYLFANDAKRYIPARIKETVAEHGEYTLTATVTDGTLHLGMVAEKPGTNWHSMQIKSLDRIDVIGDVNGDGAVDVSDYIGIANYILGQTQEGFNEKAADVNGDGKVDVSDYIGVANIILTSSVYGSGN